MIDKYKDTLFDPSYKVDIPIKHTENKQYFIKINYKNIWYLSFQVLFLLIFYYIILTIFWYNLFESHFYLATILVALNWVFSLVLLIRDRNSWKNMIDMLTILYKYMKKNQLFLFKANKTDLFSMNQKEKI